MTELLARAFEKASALSDDLQDQIAQALLDELEEEARWDRTFAESQDTLDLLAEIAEREYRAGKTDPVNALCRFVDDSRSRETEA